MSKPGEIIYRIAKWPKDMAAISDVRTPVFIEEQHVSEEEEWDGLDDQSVHVLAYVTDANGDEVPVGTARLLLDGKIGRMAVLKEYRGRNIGGKLLTMLMDEARARGHKEVTLAAQIHAIPFYERFGFATHGEEFMDANIPHRWMTASLESAGKEAGEA